MPRSRDKKTAKTLQKGALHPRNRHHGRYDFETLLAVSPELRAFVQLNPRGEQTVDFSNAQAVIALNAALLKAYYGITYWQLPKGFLCPPIPGRADYVHYLADLLAEANSGKPLCGEGLRLLDIGTGASLIYPLLAQAEYGWSCVASDVNPSVLNAAQSLLSHNSGLEAKIELRLQKRPECIFNHIVSRQDYFHATICNPPFHRSEAEAQAGNLRKRKNLSAKGGAEHLHELNFGGHEPELWCDGGEVGFVTRMITESQEFAQQVGWFTTLISKHDSLAPLLRILAGLNIADHRIVEMSQGQKQSRFLAWTFKSEKQRKQLMDLARIGR